MRAAVLVLACAACAVAPSAGEAPVAPLRLVRSIVLPGVQGRIDHLAVDADGGRLFLAALGNGSVELVDLRQGRWVRRATGFNEPQGLAWLAGERLVVVASGGTGDVTFLDGSDLRVVRRVPLGDDADNVRVDVPARQVVVGYGGGALASLSVSTGAKVQEVPLGGHPESLQLSGGGRAFVNVPSRRVVLVVDRTKGVVEREIALPEAEANYPMALDEAGHRLFVGCRRPAAMLVLDTGTGALVARVPIGGDTDDLFYDAAHRRLYAVCGDGHVTVVAVEGPDRYRVEAQVETSPGARTGLYVAAIGRLFVAAPRRDGQEARVLEFAAG